MWKRVKLYTFLQCHEPQIACRKTHGCRCLRESVYTSVDLLGLIDLKLVEVDDTNGFDGAERNSEEGMIS